MIRCAEVLTQIAFLLDDELQESERAALEEHLCSCGSCRDVFEDEGAFLSAIRNAGPLYKAPAHLRSVAEKILSEAPAAVIAPPRVHRRLRKTLDASVRKAGSSLVSRIDYKCTPAIASALIFACVVGLLLAVKHESNARHHYTSDFAKVAADAHLRYIHGQLPLEIATSATQDVSDWFSGKVPFRMDFPKSEETLGQQRPFTLQGARLVGFKNDYAAYVAYKMGTHPVSLLVTSAAMGQPAGGDEVVSSGIAFHYDSISNLNVITWEDRGLAYALVSDLDKRGRQSCVICHQGPKDQARADLGDISNSANP